MSKLLVGVDMATTPRQFQQDVHLSAESQKLPTPVSHNSCLARWINHHRTILGATENHKGTEVGLTVTFLRLFKQNTKEIALVWCKKCPVHKNYKNYAGGLCFFNSILPSAQPP